MGIGQDVVITKFKYLESINLNNGKLDGDVNPSNTSGWLKWRAVTEVLCDKVVPH